VKKTTPDRGEIMYQSIIHIDTHGEGDYIDITPEVSRIVGESGVGNGIVNLFVVGSTVALTTIEYEQGVLSDLRRALNGIAPDDIPYAHDSAWGDGNGRSHVKAAIIGPSLTIPVMKGVVQCGTWQQVVLLELDTRTTRSRTIICSVIGNAGSA
jgi:secondary thiamine-phosphate synthase enzyme